MSPAAGTEVSVAMTKWGDRPHWEFGGRCLGSDVHGDWIAVPAGTAMARPGMALVSDNHQVVLVPAADAGGRRGWLATFHGPGNWVHTYVDVTTPPSWDGTVLRTVDLDLDVIRPHDGDVFVDDEDEFAEHQLLLGYPPGLVVQAEESCRWLHDAVLREQPPFDGSAQRWLDRVTA